MATFLIGGIWHGAGWTFVLWGFLHGLALVIQKIWNDAGFKMHRVLAWFITFNFVNIAWVFFRAKEWGDVVEVLGGMADISDLHFINSIEAICLLVAFTIVIFAKNSMEILRSAKVGWWLILASGTLYFVSLAVLEVRKASEFLYFQF